MRSIFYVCHQNIFPATDGGKKSALGRILNFKETHPESKIFVVSFDLTSFSTKESEVAQKFFDQKGISFHAVFSNSTTSANRILLKAISLFSKTSYYKLFASSSTIQGQLRDLFLQNKPDTIFCEGLYAFYAIPKTSNCNIKIIAHNLESDFLRALASSCKNFLKRIAMNLNAAKVFHEEKYAFDLCKEIYFLNAGEADRSIKLYSLSQSKIKLANNTLFLPERPARKPDTNHPFLLFPGSLNFGPNLDGMKWFNANIFPQVKKEFPFLKVIITGANSSSHHEEFSAQEGYLLTGMISESELMRLYSECTSVISPILNGAGIKIKNIESIELGTPLVMTKTSAVGVFPKSNQQIACGTDSPEDFIKALKCILKETLAP